MPSNLPISLASHLPTVSIAERWELDFSCALPLHITDITSTKQHTSHPPQGLIKHEFDFFNIMSVTMPADKTITIVYNDVGVAPKDPTKQNLFVHVFKIKDPRKVMFP